MLISDAREAFTVRFLGRITFALIFTALMLVASPHRVDARTLPSDITRVATVTPPDESALSALPNVVPAKVDTASASRAVARLGSAAGDAGVRVTSAARSQVVNRVSDGSVALGDVLPARNAAPAISVAAARALRTAQTLRTTAPVRSTRSVSPVVRPSAPANANRAFVRSVASSRSVAGSRFFDRRAAAAASRVRLSVPVASGSVDRSDIVRTALTYRGVPYRYGGRSRGGIDCSGFTGRVYAETGTPLPRTAAAQFRRGAAVTRGELQQGDLVFFKNTYKSGVSHVGIYVGDGKFVHASSSRGVRVDSLGSSYFARRWAGARRAAASKPAASQGRG